MERKQTQPSQSTTKMIKTTIKQPKQKKNKFFDEQFDNYQKTVEQYQQSKSKRNRNNKEKSKAIVENLFQH